MAQDATYFLKLIIGDMTIQNAQFAAQHQSMQEQIDTLTAENEKLKGAAPHTLTFAPQAKTESVG